MRTVRAAGKWGAPLLGFGLIAGAIVVLQNQLRDYSYSDIVDQLSAAPPSSVLLALLFTVGAYSFLIGYDLLALAYIGRPLPLRRVALGSFVAHSLSHSLGFHMITGGTIRFRFWSSWGLSNAEIARALGFASTSFLLGLMLVCGIVLIFEPPDTMALLHLPAAPLRVVGALLVLAVLGAQLVVRFSSGPLRIMGTEIPMPRARLAIGHLFVAASDWTVAAAVAYVLLPVGHGISLPEFTGVFLLALVIAAIGHVPGGVGVFETLVVLMLKPHLAPPQVLGSLILYRVIYYVLPFMIGLALMIVHEIARKGTRMARVATAAVRWLPDMMPFALGTAVFAVGTLLLLSGATPLNPDRMVRFGGVIPVAIIELSHFSASVIGASLLVFAWFVQRRMRASFTVTTIALALAFAASLLRGLVWQVAVVVLLVFIALLLSRRLFTRRGSLAAEPFPFVWVVGVATVLGSSIWLGIFTFKGLDYSRSLWLEASSSGDLSRFLRASSGSLALLIGLAVQHLVARQELAADDAVNERSGDTLTEGSEPGS